MNHRACRLSGSFRLGLCALCVALLASPRCLAQAQQVSLSFAQGTQYFRRILFDLGLRPLQSMEQLADDPAEKLLILLGETEYHPPLQLEDFVKRGGAVLLATDRNCNNVLQPFGVRVVGLPVTVSANTRFAYKGFEECIFVSRPDRDSPLFQNLSVEEDLSRVASNRPGFLVPARDCNLRLLATFPRGCGVVLSDLRGEQRRFPSVMYQKGTLPFAMGGNWEQGRILILSDHSVFINVMLWQPDNENFAFAYNCVNWLTDGGKRPRVLFLEEGQIQKTFDIPLKEPPLPPLPPLKAIVETVDKELGELEKDNVFNRAIQNAVMQITSPPEKWERAVILISTLALAVFGLARLSQARHRHEKVTPAARAGPAPAPSSPSLIEQRQQLMVREGNFWEAARALARQGFESALGPQFQVHQQLSGGATATLPPLPLEGSWWRKWRVRRRFKRLWQLAYGTEPVRISSRELRRLGPEIENMKAALSRHDPPHGPPPRGGVEADSWHPKPHNSSQP